MQIVEILRTLAIFEDSDPDQLSILARHGQVRDYARGEFLLVENEASEHLFVLLSGTVGVFYTAPGGESVLVKIFGAPAVFGEMELLTDLDRLEQVEAFESAQCILLPRDAVLKMWSADAPSAMAMLTDVARRLCVAAYNERMLAFFDVETRLAALLLSFMDAYAKPSPEGGVLIRFPLSHEMLGRCLGASSRSVDRVFKKWMADELLKRHKGYLVLSSREAVEAKAPEGNLALFNRLFPG